MKTSSQYYPHIRMRIVHQDGCCVSDESTGVTVTLYTRDNQRSPFCAEVASGDRLAEIGLWFNDRELSDYDGVFFLPREVAAMLRAAGYSVSPDFCS